MIKQKLTCCQSSVSTPFRGTLLVFLLLGAVVLHAQGPNYTLEPPTNLQVQTVECAVFLTWDKPLAINSPGLIGYRIYRDGTYLNYVSGQDTTWLYDFTVMPGYHTYSVSAYYDLTEYDYPGFFDESEPVGPEEILILCSGTLPFCEYWDQASFFYHDWTFFPTQGNWSITTIEGFPPPAATFTGTPADTNYTNILSLYSYRLNTGPFTCAVIHFDYDIRLDDVSSTGAEQMAVELYYKDSWHLVDQYTNTGSFGWEHHHHEITYAGEGFMRIHFKAFGENSTDIDNWYLDNICVTPVCNPPLYPLGAFNGQDVLLTWHPPDCNQNVPQSWIQEEISYHDGNPDTTAIQYFDWVYGTVFDLSAYQNALLHEIDFHHATWGFPCSWKYRIHVVDWSTYTEAATIGPFFTSGDGGWEENIPLDSVSGLGGGMVGIFLQPWGNGPDNAWPRLTSDNSGPQGVSLYGTFPDYQTLNPSTSGDYLINLRILIPEEKEGNQTMLPMPGSTDQDVSGYFVFRSDDVMSDFTLITPDPVMDTSYIDIDPPISTGYLYYYITALFDNGTCESISDTVEVIVTHTPEFQENNITVFPNPATSLIQVTNNQPITDIVIIDLLGQELLKQTITEPKTIIDISILPNGIYFVRVTGEETAGVGKFIKH